MLLLFQAGRASQEMKKECVLRLLERLISEISEIEDVEGLITQVNRISRLYED